MSRLKLLLVGAFLVAAPARSQPVAFQEESDVATLEAEAADRSEPRRATYRLRLQSATPANQGIRVYQRLEVRDDHRTEAFFLVERDPGKPNWKDFAAFYLRWSNPATPIEVVVGDLRPGFGQGLLFSRTSRNGVGDWRARTDHRKLGYRSSGENGTFRGLAVRGRGGSLSWVLLGGSGRRDARVDETGTVISLPTSGIHVSKTERAAHDRLGLRVVGARLRWVTNGVSIGLVGQDLRFDRPLDLRRGSADLALKRQQLELAAAVAVDGSSRMGTAILIGLRLPQGRFASGWRQYRAGFANIFGRTTDATDNETAVGAQSTGRTGRFRWRLAMDQR